jgi:membrane protease YdiL (CAAX protease family)
MQPNDKLPKFIVFFLVRIIIGAVALIATVALTELIIYSILKIVNASALASSIITSLCDSFAALFVYILVFRLLEKRKIDELNRKDLPGFSFFGFTLGLVIQSLFILVIYLEGGYRIIDVNPFYFIVHSLAVAFMAGFVAELLIRGVFFRILEEKFGTILTLFIAVIFFAIAHLGKEGATWLSIAATTTEAGFMLSAAFIYSRSLWLPIFLHFAWDFVEPGIFGAINPGNSIKESWLSSEITGSSLITGGSLGPQNSVQSLLICAITGTIFLILAYRKNRFIKPSWAKSA